MYDTFNLLDENKDGFITIDEFKKNIDSIKKLTEDVKDGLFAFMDKGNIGMINYKTFIETMNLSNIEIQ